MSDDDRPRMAVTSDGGGSRGMLLAVAVLIVVAVAALWFFNQAEGADPGTGVTVSLPAGEVDPGTATTIVP